MEKLLEELRKHPKKQEIKNHPSKKDKKGNPIRYIPIHVIKSKLHNLFGFYEWIVTSGEWSMDGKTYTVIGNLSVIIGDNKITVSGIGNDGMKKTKTGGLYGDPHAFIPSAESFALSSASRKLGNAFGAFLDKEVFTESKTEDEIIKHLEGIKELDKLGVYYVGLQPHEKTAKVGAAYKSIKIKLGK